MDTQNNNGKTSFILDAEILNSHIHIVKNNKRGYDFGSVVYLCRRENKIHIKTTNGCILFHSIVDDSNGGEDFEAMVKIDKPFKYPKHSVGHIIVELDENDISFRLIWDDSKMVFPLVRDVKYPDTDSVENFDGTKPTYYQPFDPKNMQMIVDYLGGLAWIAHPVCHKSGEKEIQYKFVRDDGERKKIAVVMPRIFL